MFAKAARAFPAILLRNGGVLSAAGLSLKCRRSSAQCMEGDGEGHVRDRGVWQRHSGKSLADQFPLGRILNAPDPAGDAGPQALAKLKEIHKLSADAYGRIGGKSFRLWHPALYQVGGAPGCCRSSAPLRISNVLGACWSFVSDGSTN